VKDHKMKHRGSRRRVVLAGISLLGAVGCVPNSHDQVVGDFAALVADFVRQFLAAWMF
jgi:hypothetical protein